MGYLYVKLHTLTMHIIMQSYSDVVFMILNIDNPKGFLQRFEPVLFFSDAKRVLKYDSINFRMSAARHII